MVLPRPISSARIQLRLKKHKIMVIQTMKSKEIVKNVGIHVSVMLAKVEYSWQNMSLDDWGTII